jgi:hypothetical protein
MPTGGRREYGEEAIISRLRKFTTILHPAVDYGISSLVDFDRGIVVSAFRDIETAFVGAKSDQDLEDFIERTGVDFDFL